MIQEIPVKLIVKASDTPVISNEDEVVKTLKKVLRTYGLCVPPTVYPLGNDTYEIGRGWLLLQAWIEL